MNCNEVINFLSARVDGEIEPDDETALQAHLACCETCRRRQGEIEIQDAALMRAFGPQKELADDLANRVQRAMTPAPSAATLVNRWIIRLASMAAAVAIGFVAAVYFMQNHRPSQPIVGTIPVVAFSAQPVAQLELETGTVFLCPSTETTWHEISPHGRIPIGAAVRTTDASKCELQLRDGSCVRLNSGTEAKFTGDRTVQVSTGQIWSAVAQDATPLCVSAGKTSVTGQSKAKTQFDLACAAATQRIYVQDGSAEVCVTGVRATVNAGEVFDAPSPTAAFSCTQATDSLQTTRWQDDLLVLKPVDDPEVVTRMSQLIKRIMLDRKTSQTPGSTEQAVRALGSSWAPSLARFIRITPQNEAETRRIAARLLADLASPASIPDLTAFRDDQDPQVGKLAAEALQRLTGQINSPAPSKK